MKQIISCSRRTDIPACYYEWLQKSLKEGKVTLNNWVSGENYDVDLNPDHVQSIVLWSKNYRHVIDDPGLLKNYNLYFQFTANGYSKFLEPNVPSFEEAIGQFKILSERYSPKQINWRFDPIILSKEGEIEPTEPIGRARLIMFERFLDELTKLGIRKCTISFAILYDKVARRFQKYGFSPRQLTDQEKYTFVGKMVELAEKRNVQIYSCSDTLLEGVKGVEKGHCIDGGLLTQLFEAKATRSKDGGQRLPCGCSKSKDMGLYTQKCFHKCLYCYANPDME